MNADIKSTFGDPVTYTFVTVGAFSTISMGKPQTTRDVAVSGVRGPSSIVEDRGFKEEEVQYSILAADLGTRGQANDKVTDSGVVRTVIRFSLSVDQKWFEVVTRRKL